MKLANLEDISLDKIIQFKMSFNYSNDIIHGSNNLQYSKDLEKWMKEIRTLSKKDCNGKVRTTHFALLNDDNEMVGISDLKHHLTSYLQKEGGNISYSISPHYQNKGFGKLILKESLYQAKKYGFKKVLLTCREDNLASRKVILANNGQFIRKLIINRKTVEHYVVDLENYN